ncbi:MAG TPA: prepilin peptidase, partial [Micromonospora sp.]
MWWAVPAVTPVLRRLIVAMSVPPGQPDRSGCDRCAAPIGPRAIKRVPHGLRPLSPLARCAACAARIGAPPATVELVTAAVVAVLALAARPVPETLAFAWWGLCAVPLVFVDLAVHRLPDRLTWPAVVGTWALLGLAAAVDGDPGLRPAVAGES